MLGGLMLSTGTLLFAIVLIVVYLSRIKKYSYFENKFFVFMLIITIIILVVDVLNFIVLYDTNYVSIFARIVSKLSKIIKMLWLGGITFYFISFGAKYDVNNFLHTVKNENRLKIILIITFISIIIFLLLPFEFRRVETSYFIHGFAFMYFVFFAFLRAVSLLVIVIRNRNQLSFEKRGIMIIVTFILALCILIQLCFPYIYGLSIGFTVILYILYFSFENPDLYLIKELETAKAEIEKSNNAKSDFLSNMSHEIRSPMNAIIGFSETLLNSSKFNKQNAIKDIVHINTAGNNLLGIINNILDISKIESGKEIVEYKEYNIGNIVLELSSIIEARISSDIKFITSIDPNVPKVLIGDKTKIFQILLNLLTNAVKYTEVGKVKLNISCENKDKKCLLHISVSDTGFGIKKEDFPKIFEKFGRIETVSNDIEGTGLGLVITKKLVTLLGGDIWFESEYGVGTTFYLDISQEVSNYEKLGDILETPKPQTNREYIDCSKYSVLIVDDNKLNIKVAQRLLEPYKFSINSVTNGKDCIDEVKKGDLYDMIFLDHMMPGMDGIEVLHILKKLDGYNIPPIVALTANAITGMKEMYLNEGFDEYLSKPINTNELDKLINKYFNK